MEFEKMSCGERIDMMHKRFEWLSKLARNYPTLEEFCYKYDDYLGVRGIALKRTELNVHFLLLGMNMKPTALFQTYQGFK